MPNLLDLRAQLRNFRQTFASGSHFMNQAPGPAGSRPIAAGPQDNNTCGQQKDPKPASLLFIDSATGANLVALAKPTPQLIEGQFGAGSGRATTLRPSPRRAPIRVTSRGRLVILLAAARLGPRDGRTIQLSSVPAAKGGRCSWAKGAAI